MVDCRFYPQLLGLMCSALISCTISFSLLTSCNAIITLLFYVLLFLTHVHKVSLTLPCSPVYLFSLFSSACLYPAHYLSRGKVGASAILSRCCRLSCYGHIIFGETGRGRRDAANIFTSVSLMTHSFYPI